MCLSGIILSMSSTILTECVDHEVYISGKVSCIRVRRISVSLTIETYRIN